MRSVITSGLINVAPNRFGIISKRGFTQCSSESFGGKALINWIRLERMETDYLAQNLQFPQSTEEANTDLDNLLHLKSRILRSKLEVLASEIYTRLNFWDRIGSR